MTTKICSVTTCNNRHKGRGYCEKHLDRLRRTGSLELQVNSCKVNDCLDKYYGTGFCGKHYQRWRKYGDPLGSKPRKQAERRLNRDRYVILPRYHDHPNCQPSTGLILEHILVMSNHLGRPLLLQENVHHKNGQRDDNCLENLELWSKSQPPGQRVSDKIKWAQEILETYGNDPNAYE